MTGVRIFIVFFPYSIICSVDSGINVDNWNPNTVYHIGHMKKKMIQNETNFMVARRNFVVAISIPDKDN